MAADVKPPAGVRRWEKVLTVLLLFAFTKPFFYRAESGSSFGVLEYGLSGNIYLGLLYGATAVLVLRRPRQVWETARTDLLIWALVAVSTLSFYWSLEPYVSFRAGFFLFATTVAGAVMAATFSHGEQLDVTAGALALAAGFSLLAGVAAPSYAVDGSNWLGVFLHKNHLGRYMALGAIVFALLAVRRGPWRRWAPLGIVASVLLVLLSGSSTAAVVVLGLAALMPLCLALGAQFHLAVALLTSATLFGGMATVFFLANKEAVLAALGRDPTLTGRTDLWQALADIVMQRPWLGYGYQAFWFIPENSDDVKAVAGWVGTSAHNGFLETALAIGFVGLGLLTIGFVRSGAVAVRNLRRDPGVDGAWPAVFLAYFLAYNLTETSVLLPNNILWVVYVAVVFSLRRRAPLPAREPVRQRRFEPMVQQARRSPSLVPGGGGVRRSPSWERRE